MDQTKDGTHYLSIINAWGLIEVASGIVAACLPYAPKFFKSLKDLNLWSGIRSYSHLSAQLKTRVKPFGTRTDENKAERCHNGMSSLNALFRKHNISSSGIELTLTSMKGGKGSSHTLDNSNLSNP